MQHQFGLQILDTRQAFLEALRQLLEQPEFRDAHWLRRIAKGILDDDLIPRLTQDQTDARLIAGMLQQVVDGGQVEIHLPGVLRLESAGLQIDNHERSESEMVKEQIETEILPCDLQRILASDESEAHAEFEQELTNVVEKCSFQVAFPGLG